MQRVEYHVGTKRTLYHTLNSANITAKAVIVDGHVLSLTARGWNLTKNICELYGTTGYIRTAYTYSPYGQVTATGNVTQPIQWSSEYNDTELGLVYYNYRHYNPVEGRWLGRDPETEVKSTNLYYYVSNNVFNIDYIGKLNLGKLIYSTLNKTSLFIDGGCISASISFDKLTPIIMIGPFPLRFYISLTGASDSCCDKNTKQTRCFFICQSHSRGLCAAW